MFDVTVVGSANLDLVAGVERLPAPGETLLGSSYAEFPGGKGLNQAVAAARAGARVAFVGAVGDDDAGRRLIGVASGEGIDVAHLAVDPRRPTGRAMITVADDAENSIVVIPGANAAVDGVDAPPATVVAAQLEVPIDAVMAAFAAARRRGATTVLNPAPAHDIPDGLVELCDVVVPNEHEVELLGGADELLRRGAGTVVVTRGAAGVRVVEAGEVTDQPPFPVQPVDTTGAGDAFCGVLAATVAAGAPLAAAVRRAAAAGALATTVAGAVPSLPTAQAVDALAG